MMDNKAPAFALWRQKNDLRRQHSPESFRALEEYAANPVNRELGQAPSAIRDSRYAAAGAAKSDRDHHEGQERSDDRHFNRGR
jgi:hypothetical protein